jgi:hypothetical protein
MNSILNKNINLVSYLVKNFFYFYHINKLNLRLSKFEKNLKELKLYGVSVIKNFITQKSCENIVQLIDQFIKEKKNNIDISESLDHRLYGMENFSEVCKNFLKNKDLLNLIYKYENNKEIVDSLCLGAYIKYIENGKGSGLGWHRDRTNFKFKYSKAMIYLNNVNNENGPFQYLVGSHKLKNILKINYKYNLPYSQKWFADDFINKISNELSIKIETLLAKPGDCIVFDGRGIHRGKPLLDGFRYAITGYYRFDKEELLPFKLIN